MSIAILFSSAVTDMIQGITKDLLSPILNHVIPGSHEKPLVVFGVPLFLTRFVMRLVLFILSLIVIYSFSKGASVINNNRKIS
jgi:large-conductance mechanosensitive channel